MGWLVCLCAVVGYGGRAGGASGPLLQSVCAARARQAQTANEGQQRTSANIQPTLSIALPAALAPRQWAAQPRWVGRRTRAAGGPPAAGTMKGGAHHCALMPTKAVPHMRGSPLNNRTAEWLAHQGCHHLCYPLLEEQLPGYGPVHGLQETELTTSSKERPPATPLWRPWRLHPRSRPHSSAGRVLLPRFSAS